MKESINLPLTSCLAKQRFISSILLCAFAVLFAHSIIPHHHHEEATTTHQSSDRNDEQNDLKNNLLGQAFANFQHENSGGITYQTDSSTFQCLNLSVDKDITLFTPPVIVKLFKPPITHSKHYFLDFTSLRYSACSLFRGPPMA